MNKHKIIHAMELAAIAYKQIQPEHPHTTLTVIDSPKTGVQGFLRQNGDQLSIAFRGTDSLQDWKMDLKFWQKTIPYGNTVSPIRVHTGFINAYKNPQVREFLHRFVTPDIHFIRITGHSYGAALAVLCAVDLEYNFPGKDIEVILFGCPRVGNQAFQKSYDQRVFKTIRVENGNDIVTKIPFAIMGYRHVGIKFHIGPPRIWGRFSNEHHRQQTYYASLLQRLLP